MSRASSTDAITVAAASDLQYAMQEVAARFETATRVRVRFTFGSSGNFYSQIASGAPFDLFLSADSEYPKRLIAAGVADRDSLVVYGTGRIVLWVPRSSRLDVNQGLKVLLDPTVRKIALANPQHAPYGRAAVAALRHEGLYDRLNPKFVLGENIAQTMHFMESGDVDIGFVALSLATAPPAQGKGRYWIVPQDFYPAIEQAGVVVSHSSNKTSASRFLNFLRTPEIVGVMERYGFEPAGTRK